MAKEPQELTQTAEESQVSDLTAELLDLLENMAAAGQAPHSALLVKLSDGRVRILPPDEPRARLERLRNEYGPLAAALRVDGEGLAVEDWLSGEPRRAQRGYRGAAAGLSRNSAIFLASLGMTTGALPNVEASFSPDGVSSAPVW